MDENSVQDEIDVEYGTCGMLSRNIPGSDHDFDIIKSRLCVCYIETLCSYLDLDCSEPKQGNDVSGWDVRIEPVNVKDEWERKPTLYIQLKGTTNPAVHDKHISFSLDRRTYDQLRKASVRDRTLLAVMCFEDDTSKWVNTNSECLMMRRVMYWCKPEAYREIPEGQENVTLHLPLTNVLNKESLHKMMDILSRGEVFGNVL